MVDENIRSLDCCFAQRQSRKLLEDGGVKPKPEELLKSGSRNEIPIIIFNDCRNDTLDPAKLFSRLEPFYVDESMI